MCSIPTLVGLYVILHCSIAAHAMDVECVYNTCIDIEVYCTWYDLPPWMYPYLLMRPISYRMV